MTAELARAAATLMPMDTSLDLPQAMDLARGADLTSRLERLRLLRRSAPSALGAPGLAVARPVPDVRAAAQRRAQALADALGGEIVEAAGGRVVRVVARAAIPLDPALLAALPYPVDPARPLLCLDTETTGLGTAAGTLVFLVGLGRWDGETFAVEQLVLPDQPDEPAFLAALRAAIPPDAWLVTYNGRGFDWPLLVTRYRLQRSPPPPLAGHLDLLPIARQLWRHRLDDARLATVEAGVVGVRRTHDLPGALIPARYLAFLRDGRADALREVIEHNRQDVVSLGLLVAQLGVLAGDSGRSGAHHGDLSGLARAYARRRRWDEAIGCAGAAIDACPDPRERERLLAARCRILWASGRRDEAAAAWAELAERGGPLAAIAWIQLAKHREHVLRDLPEALAATERAAAIVERARLLGRDLPRLERDIGHRRARLRRRLARSRHLEPIASTSAHVERRRG